MLTRACLSVPYFVTKVLTVKHLTTGKVPLHCPRATIVTLTVRPITFMNHPWKQEQVGYIMKGNRYIPTSKRWYPEGGGGGGTWVFRGGGRIRSLSKLKNTPKALISGQKSTLIL